MNFDVQKMSDRKRQLPTFYDQSMMNLCSKCPMNGTICSGFKWDSDGRWCDRDCESCMAPCCDGTIVNRVMEECEGTLEWDDISWEPWDIEWPDFIHQINGKVRGLYRPIYVVSVKKIISFETMRWSPQKDLRKRFLIPENSLLAISFATKDEYLDAIYGLPGGLQEIAEAIAEFNPDFVFAINFSVYQNWPQLANLSAMRLRMMSIREFQKVGLKVVPDLTFLNDLDMERWAGWVNENGVKAIHINTQTLKEVPSSGTWKLRLKKYHDFRSMIGDDVRFILLGSAGLNRMSTIVEASFGKVSFLDTKSYRLAEFYKDIRNEKCPEMSVRDIFGRSCLILEQELLKLRKQHGQQE